MPAEMERFPDHGDESTWVVLSGEETRCYIGLTKYFITFEEKAADVARELAWVDLKREFPRLADATWHK